MKTAFGELISRLDMAEERPSKLEDVSVETSQTEKQGEQRLRNRREYPRTVGRLQRRDMDVMRTPGREESEKGTQEIFETVMTENFPKN